MCVCVCLSHLIPYQFNANSLEKKFIETYYIWTHYIAHYNEQSINKTRVDTREDKWSTLVVSVVILVRRTYHSASARKG